MPMLFISVESHDLSTAAYKPAWGYQKGNTSEEKP